MRYDPEVTFDAGKDIGRPDLNDPRTKEGELMFPARFSEKAVQDLELDLGAYRCTPYESPILMGDLSYKPIGEIEVGDEIIGFTLPSKGTKTRLCLTKVLETHKYRAKINKMTLSSGKEIRCTPDHQWFTKFRGSDRSPYHKATVGSKLARISNISDTELHWTNARKAGWLAGFFDGDGSCTSVDRGTGSITSSIKFYQGAGRNIHNCNRLEQYLNDLGFEYSYTSDDRSKNLPNSVNPEYRHYRLLGNTLPMYQRFLHQIDPVKWRDRMIQGALTSKYVLGREEVVRIESDGIALCKQHAGEMALKHLILAGGEDE
jgi:hypothetical protein